VATRAAGCRLPANWVLQDKIGDLLKRPALIIAPTGVQRQAFLTEPPNLTERLRFLSTRDQLIGYYPDSEFVHAPNPVDAHVEPNLNDIYTSKRFARLGRSYAHDVLQAAVLVFRRIQKIQGGDRV
jgi:hypothetical protein